MIFSICCFLVSSFNSHQPLFIHFFLYTFHIYVPVYDCLYTFLISLLPIYFVNSLSIFLRKEKETTDLLSTYLILNTIVDLGWSIKKKRHIFLFFDSQRSCYLANSMTGKEIIQYNVISITIQASHIVLKNRVSFLAGVGSLKKAS